MNEEELTHRIKNAIILLTDGHPYKVGDLTFGCIDKSHFSVTGWTTMNDLAKVTNQSALDELTDVKTLFIKMTDASKDLADFLNGRKIEYCLGYDYGMGAIGICKEIDGNLIWEADLKN